MLKAWAAKGVKPPADVLETLEEPADDEPILDWVELQYLMLFNDASTCRSPAFAGVPPIPVTAIRQTVRDHGWPEDDADLACELVRRLDAEALRHWAEKKS